MDIFTLVSRKQDFMSHYKTKCQGYFSVAVFLNSRGAVGVCLYVRVRVTSVFCYGLT